MFSKKISEKEIIEDFEKIIKNYKDQLAILIIINMLNTDIQQCIGNLKILMF